MQRTYMRGGDIKIVSFESDGLARNGENLRRYGAYGLDTPDSHS
jgi:hypothetical protein